MPPCVEAATIRFDHFSFRAICNFLFAQGSHQIASNFFGNTFHKIRKMSSSNSSNSGDSSPSLARSRWGILQQAILKKTIPEAKGNPASKRVFDRYPDLVSWTYDASKTVIYVQVHVNSGKKNAKAQFLWENENSAPAGTLIALRNASSYEGNNGSCDGVVLSAVNKQAASNKNLEGVSTNYAVQVYHRESATNVDIKNLKGFDNTGRICIWPSEQILCYWSLKNQALFEGKNVIEIGGGFHCLAGLALAKHSKANLVVLTDGDEVNVEQVSYSIQRNNLQAFNCYAKTFRWDMIAKRPELASTFDFVIAADVVYENSIFRCILETVSHVLKPEGQFILFNPTRNGMLQEFVNLAKSVNAFSDVKFNETYDQRVSEISWDLEKNNPSFNLEWHYPNQVTFKKAGSLVPRNELKISNPRPYCHAIV